MRCSVCTLVAVLALAGCRTGPRLENFPPANSPAGVATTLGVGRQRIKGELLEVNDSGFVVRQTPQITFVPFTVVREAKFAGIGAMSLRSPEAMVTLRHASRFPAGIPPAVLPRLLEEAGQREIVVIR
jgi:hypothetical protein